MSSHDILGPYLAIGISKESNQESRNQAKILHDSESCRQKLQWQALRINMQMFILCIQLCVKIVVFTFNLTI